MFRGGNGRTTPNDREQRVIELVAQGLKNKEVADEIGTTEHVLETLEAQKDGWRVAATKLFVLLACDTRGRLKLVLLCCPLRAKAPARSLSIQVRSRTVVERGVNVHPHPNVRTAQVRRRSGGDLRQSHFDQQRFE